MKNCRKYLRRAGILVLIVCMLTVSMSGTVAGHVFAKPGKGESISELEDKRQETLDEIDNLKESHTILL